MKKIAVLAGLAAGLLANVAFADECLLMKDSRHVYDFGGDAITIVGQTCETSATQFLNDIATDQTITCEGLKPVTVSFQSGEFFANEDGREEQLVEACD